MREKGRGEEEGEVVYRVGRRRGEGGGRRGKKKGGGGGGVLKERERR